MALGENGACETGIGQQGPQYLVDNS